jgi:hypothetical protein
LAGARSHRPFDAGEGCENFAGFRSLPCRTKRKDIAMAEHSRGPDDRPDRRAFRFGLRGKQEIIDCYVTWEALDRLEGGPADTRAEPASSGTVRRSRPQRLPSAKAGSARLCSMPMK